MGSLAAQTGNIAVQKKSRYGHTFSVCGSFSGRNMVASTSFHEFPGDKPTGYRLIRNLLESTEVSPPSGWGSHDHRAIRAYLLVSWFGYMTTSGKTHAQPLPVEMKQGGRAATWSHGRCCPFGEVELSVSRPSKLLRLLRDDKSASPYPRIPRSVRVHPTQTDLRKDKIPIQR